MRPPTAHRYQLRVAGQVRVDLQHGRAEEDVLRGAAGADGAERGAGHEVLGLQDLARGDLERRRNDEQP
jgi:hypothetical protein